MKSKYIAGGHDMRSAHEQQEVTPSPRRTSAQALHHGNHATRGEVGGQSQRTCADAFDAITIYSARTEPVATTNLVQAATRRYVCLLTCTAMSTSSKRPSSAAVPSASFRSAAVCSSRAACSSSTFFDLQYFYGRSGMTMKQLLPAWGSWQTVVCSAACIASLQAASVRATAGRVSCNPLGPEQSLVRTTLTAVVEWHSILM